MLLLSVVCLALSAHEQETTGAPIEVPEITMGPEPIIDSETDSTSTFSPEASESTTIVLPDSVASSTTEEPSTTAPSVTTTEVIVETTTAVNETIDGNSTDCKDTTPALCKSFATLCQAPKHCNGKEGGSHEKSTEAGKNDKVNGENPEKPIQPTAGVDNDGDNDDAICAWVRMQTLALPELREIAANCDQKNSATPLHFLKGGLIGGLPDPKPQPPKKPTDSKKQLDCRFREVASVSFRRLCPATCSLC